MGRSTDAKRIISTAATHESIRDYSTAELLYKEAANMFGAGSLLGLYSKWLSEATRMYEAIEHNKGVNRAFSYLIEGAHLVARHAGDQTRENLGTKFEVFSITYWLMFAAGIKDEQTAIQIYGELTVAAGASMYVRLQNGDAIVVAQCIDGFDRLDVEKAFARHAFDRTGPWQDRAKVVQALWHARRGQRDKARQILVGLASSGDVVINTIARRTIDALIGHR